MNNLTNNFLELKNVSLNFPGCEKYVLKNINYQVKPHDFIIILGHNGSGKSSLLKLCQKKYLPTSGDIFLEGQSLFSKSLGESTTKTLTQDPKDSLFSSLTVLENYILSNRHQKIPEKSIITEYLSKFNKNLPNKLNQSVNQLSGGEQQALALALTVLHPPKLLLLDEHTSALDPKAAENILELTKNIVEKFQITCLMTTHDLSIVKHHGNRVLVLHNGEIRLCLNENEKRNMSEQDLRAACY